MDCYKKKKSILLLSEKQKKMSLCYMSALIFFTRSLSLKDCLDVSKFFLYFLNSKNIFLPQVNKI